MLYNATDPCSAQPFPLCFCSASWPESGGAIKPDVQSYFRNYLLYLLGGFHLFFSLWMFVEYFVVNYPNFVFPLPNFFYTVFKRWVSLCAEQM